MTIKNLTEQEVSRLLELKGILCPPPYKPSQAEVQLAAIQFVFENYVYDIMSTLRDYHTYKETGDMGFWRDESRFLDRVNYALGLVKRYEESDDPNWWEGFVSKERLVDVVDGLAELHCGDCTAIPCTCSRCYAEGLFGIPYTATWSGKHEGSELFHEYMQLLEKADIKHGDF